MYVSEAVLAMPRLHWMSLVFVSERSGWARELRMPRFLFGLLALVVVLGLLGPVILLALPSGIVEVTFGSNREAQMKSVEEKSIELTRQLEELKETARSIRRLAGVERFDSESLAPGADVDGPLAASRDGLPFLTDDGLPARVEGVAGGERSVPFRYVPSIWPVAGWVTREFQQGEDPIVETHFGLDVAARESAPVICTADGIVTFADWDQNLGWLVEIDHGYDMVTRYGHNARLRVDRGQPVRRGQIIALVGNTGRSSAPHLHYEVWKDNAPVDPRGYLPEVIRWDDLLLSLRTQR